MNKTQRIIREIVPISEEDFFIVLNHKNAKFDFPVHYHPEIELNLVMKSKGKRIIGDSILDYDDMDLVMIGSNTPHAWTGDSKNQYAHVITIQFHENFFHENTLERKLTMPIRDMLEISKRGIMFSKETTKKLMSKIIALPESQDFDSLVNFLTILNTLSLSKGKTLLASPSFASSFTISKSRRIEKVHDYIKQNLYQKIKLKDVADMVNMSESAFSHFFKKRTHSSFSDYLIDLRLRHAARMLIETKQSVSEICFDSGFNNISNFNRTFKRKKGLTPSEFREQQELITKH